MSTEYRTMAMDCLTDLIESHSGEETWPWRERRVIEKCAPARILDLFILALRLTCYHPSLIWKRPDLLTFDGPQCKPLFSMPLILAS
jgi:hypothetical protein